MYDNDQETEIEEQLRSSDQSSGNGAVASWMTIGKRKKKRGRRSNFPDNAITDLIDIASSERY